MAGSTPLPAARRGGGFIEHMLRTYGPWDAEDATLLSYFTSGDASVRWDQLEAEPPPMNRTGKPGVPGGELGVAVEELGVLVMLSGAIKLAHFAQWWRCWGHAEHGALRFMFHIDAGVPAATRAKLETALAGDARVAIVPLRYSIAGSWGATSLVYIQLIGTDLLLQAFPRAAFVLNLSLHDVLVMPLAEVLRLLAAPAAVDFALEGKHDRPLPMTGLRRAGGPRAAPFRLQHFVDAGSRQRFDLPPTPAGVQGSLWAPRASGLTVEVGHSQWMVLSRAGAQAVVRERALVELLLSLKHTTIADERFMGSAAAWLVGRRGLSWRWSPPLRYVAWNEPRFRLTHTDLDGLLANATEDRPFTARKAYYYEPRGDDHGATTPHAEAAAVWQRAWQAAQPACVAASAAAWASEAAA